MGYTLSIETNTQAECPFWFAATDSKALFAYLVERHVWRIEQPDVLGPLVHHLQLDIAPLRKIAGEAYTLEDYLDWAGTDPEERRRAEEAWHRESAINLAAWQSPHELRLCLDRFLVALQTHPTVFNDLGITISYFTSGNFQRDLHDLQQMAAWAQEQGIEQVRLAYA